MTEPVINDAGIIKTLSQWLKDFPTELNIDAIGLWQIFGDGQGFGFKDQELIDYVKLAIRTVLEAGALPVWGGLGTDFDWVYKPHYGITHDEIVKNVIQEWAEIDYKNPEFGGVWFARPGDVDIDISPWRPDLS